MNRSRNSSLSSYYEAASRIIGKFQDPEKDQKSDLKERLTFKDIQNITRSMIKQKKSFQNNMGVITNIKGKMYCLKLGEVSKPKQFSHYFFSNQYKRKVSSSSVPRKLL